MAAGFAAAVLTALVVVGTAWAQAQIKIEANWLDPRVLHATVDERVTFVNRSGLMAHVEFLGDSRRHHVTQVPTEIWVVFHAPGRHSYVVHFPESEAIELRGEVEVMGDPRGRPDGRTCDGITIMGACLEQ